MSLAFKEWQMEINSSELILAIKKRKQKEVDKVIKEIKKKSDSIIKKLVIKVKSFGG